LNLIKALLLILCLCIATPARATWTTFDATDDIYTVTQFAAINLASFTVVCHALRAGAGENSTGRILDKGTDADVDGWQLNTTTANIEFAQGNAGATDGFWTISIPTSPFHIAVSYDGASSSNDPNIYVNGTLQSESEDSTPSNAMVTGTRDLTIGNRGDVARTWDGQIGDCAKFSGALAAGKILQAQHYGPVFVGNAICYWPLGSFAGRSYGGSSGSTCNATAAGSPATAETGPKRSSPQGGFILLGQ
jgi:hypothetical protein